MGRVTGTDIFRTPGYLKFWTAGTVSDFGSYVTSMALQVLVVLTLHGSALDVGFLNGARWVPYLLFGLVVGALVDRRRRRPIVVGTDLGRALLLGAIPLLWVLGWLTLPILLVFVALFGFFSLVNDAATMSFLPRLVPSSSLLAANARLDQSAGVAQTSGPLIGGALVTALGAPLAVLVDAASYLFSGALLWRIRIDEPAPARRTAGGPTLRGQIGEGLRFVYGHRMLRPQSITTHVWFLFNSIVNTVFVPFVLLGLHFSAFELGIALAFTGMGGLLGSVYSRRIGLRWGAGRAVIACQVLGFIAWAVVASAPGVHGGTGWAALAVIALGQALYGISLGASNANEMGYRQAVTPDALQARVNTSMRSINRAAIVIGAPLGGLLAEVLGYRQTLWIGVAGFVLVAIALAASPFRNARHGDETNASHT